MTPADEGKLLAELWGVLTETQQCELSRRGEAMKAVLLRYEELGAPYRCISTDPLFDVGDEARANVIAEYERKWEQATKCFAAGFCDMDIPPGDPRERMECTYPLGHDGPHSWEQAAK